MNTTCSSRRPGLLESRISRRRFIYLSTAAGVLVLSRPLPASLRLKSPNDKLNVAIIGAGGRGAHNTSQVKNENIVALCDVNENALAAAGQRFPGARRYVDFRKLFDEVNDIDAVVVSTTDHTHAFATLPALQLGKHVFCEKPLTHSIWEARLIADAAREAKVATQMGIQMHANSNYRRVVELVQTGAIGPVREVHVWVSRAWGDGDRPAETPPTPSHFHWDLWLGPAPERPYHPDYVTSKPGWYKWWDFAGGTVSDLGSHWMDLPFWALKLRQPLTAEAFGPEPHPETAPASLRSVFEYAARGEMPPVTVTWYQGEPKPPQWTEGRIPKWGDGMLFVGRDGMVQANYHKHILLPEEKFADFQRPEPFIPESIGHHQEWIHACKTGEPTTCDFAYSGLLTEANHLGNVAYRIGKKIEWDPIGMQAKNAPEASGLIRREYRKGWTLASR
jgi:predicted dehydrogenase